VPRHDLSVGALVSTAGIALVFLAAALAGIVLTRETGNVAVFWLPNAILAGVLLRIPSGRHLATIVGCFLVNTAANLLYGDTPGIAAGLATCNMLEAVLAWQLVARLTGPTFILSDLRQLFVLLSASLAAPLVSATVAAGLFSPALDMAPATLWWNWWTSAAVGMLLVLPLVTSFDARPLKRLLVGPRDRHLFLSTLEIGSAFGLLGAALWLIARSDAYGSSVLFMPILLWVALRFGACAVAAAAVIMVTVVTAVAHEAWPLPFTSGSNGAARVVPLQLFAILVTVPLLIVAVLVRQRTQALQRLDDAVESMADAFALYDADGRLVICNRRYHEYLAPIADLLSPGVRFEELVREGT
jgi:integral membrane sensor domain MASE1